MVDITNKLEVVISQAMAIGIPVSTGILKNVVVNTRARTRFGCCKKQKDSYSIEVSAAVANGPEASLLQTLAHEILHTCPGCQNHSTGWKTYAAAMNSCYGYNIKRTSTPEELGLTRHLPAGRVVEFKYILICRSCGQTIERRRKSKLVTHPHHYRCRCGGKIEKV